MFSLKDKINYYRSRLGLADGNKRNYARGFVNGSSLNSTEKHFKDAKKELFYLNQELKSTENLADRQDILESIYNCKGYLAGFNAKQNKKL